MISTLFGFLHGGSMIFGLLAMAGGPVAFIVSHFLPTTWKIVAMAIGLVLVLGFIGYQKVEIADQTATIAQDEARMNTLVGWLQTAQKGEQDAVAANQVSTASFSKLSADYKANVSALAAQRDQLAAALKAARIANVGSSLDVAEKACPGPVPLPVRDVLDLLRQPAGG